MRKLIYAAICAFLLNLHANTAAAAEPGWSPVIIATGAYREQIRSTPIERRPYRPLHFYGNAVRRNHYRGTMLPVPTSISPMLVIRGFGFTR